MPSYEKKGYLTTDFKIFHLKDTVLREFQYHYHEFDKIIIFLSGRVDYMIEGKSYSLHPHGDCDAYKRRNHGQLAPPLYKT